MSIDKIIPFNKPFIVGQELYNIAQAVIVGSQLSGNGEYTQKCQQWIEDHSKIKKALLTHSCTGALEMAAILCGIAPGDEIIMPSFTFVSTANAFVLRGGVPVFVDIRNDTLNIDENLIEKAITPKTKAIVPVHYAGAPCNMDAINHIASKHNLFVIEDAAQGFSSYYKNKALGSLGHLGCLSFHETKNIICGEGGALLINDDRLIKRAEIIWEKGTNRNEFLRKECDKYTWVDIGSSFLPGEITAAFLYAQLEQSEHIISNRQKTHLIYHQLLKPLEANGLIRLPDYNNNYSANGHIFYIITNTQQERSELISTLAEQNIYSVFHYIPLHSSPAGKKFGRASGNMCVTDEISDRILRLPLFYGMQENEVRRVAETIIDFYKGNHFVQKR
jgi:dTDP-4-amino-4,6-dideoxygalactose transaminase